MLKVPNQQFTVVYKSIFNNEELNFLSNSKFMIA